MPHEIRNQQRDQYLNSGAERAGRARVLAHDARRRKAPGVDHEPDQADHDERAHDPLDQGGDVARRHLLGVLEISGAAIDRSAHDRARDAHDRRRQRDQRKGDRKSRHAGIDQRSGAERRNGP